MLVLDSFSTVMLGFLIGVLLGMAVSVAIIQREASKSTYKLVSSSEATWWICVTCLTITIFVMVVMVGYSLSGNDDSYVRVLAIAAAGGILMWGVDNALRWWKGR